VKATSFATLLLLVSAAGAQAGGQQALQCDVGGIDKVYGGTHWTVYSCHDTKNLVIVSAQGNSASPFYFQLGLTDDGQRHLDGEGAGNKPASDAAGDDIAKLSIVDIKTLIQETVDKAGERH
jgi:hypothetical protein